MSPRCRQPVTVMVPACEPDLGVVCGVLLVCGAVCAAAIAAHATPIAKIAPTRFIESSRFIQSTPRALQGIRHFRWHGPAADN
jgi:hypothetical protein